MRRQTMALRGMRGFAIALAIGATGAGQAGETVPADHREWRAQRVEKLTRSDGWLTLVGLHFLKEGANTVGRAPSNAVVLAAGPERVGTVQVHADGTVTLTVAPGHGVKVDGSDVGEATLAWRPPAKPTLVTFGTGSFFVIERGGRKALRVKDSEAERRRRFGGLDYFPYDPAWRVVARWRRFDQPRSVAITNILGQVSQEPAAGVAIFEREGRTIELLAIDEGADAPLFFIVADATSGKETYGGGRHLYAARPTGGTIELDFNRAENPPCAFTPFSTCPVPPAQNRLPFAVSAGEKTYRDGTW